MRAISTALRVFLNSNTRCVMRHLVTLTLVTGTIVRWTDHTQNITVGGNTFQASGSGTAPVVEVGGRRDPAGTEIGDLELMLYCGDTAQLDGVRLPLAVINDALDGAKVKVERVYGLDAIDLTLGTMHLFEGVVAETDPSSTVVKLSLVDARQTLSVVLPKTRVQPSCTNALFDNQCVLLKSTYTRTGTVSAGSTAALVNTSRTEADGWFALGVITFTSGANNGVKRAIRAYKNASGQFELSEPLPATPAVGDTFSAYPGCDKRFPTCRDKFSNPAHLRGFPLMPGDANDTRMRYSADPGNLNGQSYLTSFIGQDPTNTPRDIVLPIVYGRNIVDGVVVYRAGPYSSQNGNAIQAAFCEGPIVDGRRFWVDSKFYKSIHDIDNKNSALPEGISGPRYDQGILRVGTRPTQSQWWWHQYNDAGALALTYPGVAHWDVSYIKIPIGQSQTYRLEVDGFLAGADGDAHPASILGDASLGLLTNNTFGAGFAWPVVTDVGPDGNATSSARTYITAAGLLLSPVLREQRKTLDTLQEILDSTNCSCRMSDGTLEIVPLGDVAFTQNSTNYTPDLTIQYAFTLDNIPGDGDSVTVKRPSQADIYNIIPVSFSERDPQASDPSKAYVTRSVESPEPVDVAQNGERRASAVSLPMIAKPTVALTISKLLAQKSLRRRNLYTWKAGFQFAPLEPLDYVTLTDSRFGLANRVVRIQAVEEDKDGTLTIEAEDAPIGMSHAVANTVQISESTFVGSPFLSFEQRVHQLALSTWKGIAPPSGNSFGAGCRGADKYVIVDAGNGITSYGAYSDYDGEKWTTSAPPAGTGVAIATNGNVYVTVGLDAAASSTDGVTWTPRSIPVAGIYYDVIWSKTAQQFIASAAGKVALSPDGITWTGYTVAGAGGSMADNGRVIVMTAGSNVMTSTDGINWTTNAVGFTFGASAGLVQKPIIADSSGFVALVYVTPGAANQLIGKSSDGITWTTIQAPKSVGVFTGIGWTGQLYVLAEYGWNGGAGLWTSPDGGNWSRNTNSLPSLSGYELMITAENRTVLVLANSSITLSLSY